MRSLVYMISDYRCFFCFSRALEKFLEKADITVAEKESFIDDMLILYQEKHDNLIAPEFSRELHNLLKKYTLNPDPYKDEKKKYNDFALNLIPELKDLIGKSDDPFDTGLRLAIAGNIIDFAAGNNFDVHAAIKSSLSCGFAIDHSKELLKAIREARHILYLGDNAGEIVFDRLFIETINHPDLVYAVRGGPVINDATLEDAEYTGMNEAALTISNEYDAASTIVSKSGRLFREYFEKADLVISKGQGNLEGLVGMKDDRIFFLLMAKCNVMADYLKCEKGSLAVFNSSLLANKTCL